MLDPYNTYTFGIILDKNKQLQMNNRNQDLFQFILIDNNNDYVSPPVCADSTSPQPLLYSLA